MARNRLKVANLAYSYSYKAKFTHLRAADRAVSRVRATKRHDVRAVALAEGKTPAEMMVRVTAVTAEMVMTTSGDMTWATLREAARTDLPDPDQIGQVYRAILADARAKAWAAGLMVARVVCGGLYVSPHNTRAVATYERAWAAVVGADYGLPPSAVIGRCEVEELDPDVAALGRCEVEELDPDVAALR